MKKYMYITGILCANLFTAGSICKVMHWPGANMLLVTGTFLFSLIFLPWALHQSYSELKRYKSLHIVTFVVFSMGVITILFKVLHWPGANILFQLTFPLPFVLFLPVYLYQTRMEKRINDINFLGIVFGLTFIAGFSVLLSI